MMVTFKPAFASRAAVATPPTPAPVKKQSISETQGGMR